MGFRKEEELQEKEQKKLKGGGKFDKEKKMVKVAMGEKVKDNFGGGRQGDESSH